MNMTEEEILGLVTHGGGTLVFIALASLIALTLAIERFLAMRKVMPETQALHREVIRYLGQGSVNMAFMAAGRSHAFFAEVYLAGFSRWQQKKGRDFEAAVDRARLSHILVLKKRLWAIGTVGTIAPFIGLFGTVVGIMSAFSSMAETGTGGFAVVASGISQALIATASGIAVAIEAVVFFNFFQARLGAISAEMKLLCDEFCEVLTDTPFSPIPADVLLDGEGEERQSSTGAMGSSETADASGSVLPVGKCGGEDGAAAPADAVSAAPLEGRSGGRPMGHAEGAESDGCAANGQSDAATRAAPASGISGRK